MSPDGLKTERTKLGLSQAALAVILGVRQATVSNWETGKQPIPKMLELAMQAVHKQ